MNDETTTITSEAPHDPMPDVVHSAPSALRPSASSRKGPKRGWFVHSSGRFDRPLHDLRASVERLRGMRGPDEVVLVSGTESSHRPDSFLRGKGWESVHLDGAGRNECWATWRSDALELIRPAYARRIADRQWYRVGGSIAPKVHALVIPLRVVNRRFRRKIYVVVIHMPLDNTPLRASIWFECCDGLRDVAAEIRAEDPTAEIVFLADWNKNWRQAPERAAIQSRLAGPLGLQQAWDGHAPKRGGTHGPISLLDGAILAAKAIFGCELVKDDDSSDHRPMRVGVKFRLVPRRLRRRKKGA